MGRSGVGSACRERSSLGSTAGSDNREPFTSLKDVAVSVVSVETVTSVRSVSPSGIEGKFERRDSPPEADEADSPCPVVPLPLAAVPKDTRRPGEVVGWSPPPACVTPTAAPVASCPRPVRDERRRPDVLAGGGSGGGAAAGTVATGRVTAGAGGAVAAAVLRRGAMIGIGMAGGLGVAAEAVVRGAGERTAHERARPGPTGEGDDAGGARS